MNNDFSLRHLATLSKSMNALANYRYDPHCSLHDFNNNQSNTIGSRLSNSLVEDTMTRQANHLVREANLEIMRKNFETIKCLSEHIEATNRNIKLYEVVAITVTLIFVILVDNGLVF